VLIVTGKFIWGLLKLNNKQIRNVKMSLCRHLNAEWALFKKQILFEDGTWSSETFIVERLNFLEQQRGKITFK
jgi:hypothetical protein